MTDLWRGYIENEQLEFRRSFDGEVLVIRPHEKVPDAWVCVLPEGTRIISELAGVQEMVRITMRARAK